MAIVVLIFGGLLSILGIAGYIYGFDLLPTERGVAGVIAAAVVFVGGILAVALGLVLIRLEELIKLLSTRKPAQAAAPVESTRPVTIEAPLATPDLPKVVALEPPGNVAVEKPAVAFDKPRSRPEPAKSISPVTPVPMPAVVPAPAPSPSQMPGPAVVASAAIAAGAAVAATVVAAAKEPPLADKADAADAMAGSVEMAADPRKLSASQRLDALTERLRAPLERPRIAPIELPKLDLSPIKLSAPDDTPSASIAMPADAAKPLAAGEIEYDVEVLAEIAPSPAPEVAETVPMPPEDLPAEALPVEKPAVDGNATGKAMAEDKSAGEAAGSETSDADATSEDAAAADPLADFEAELEKFLPLGRNEKKGEEPGVGVAEVEAKPASEVVPATEAEKPEASDIPSPALEETATRATPPETTTPEAKAPAAAEPAPKPLIPAPGAEVVGAYESGGAKYTMYSDGSVVAEAGGETLYFKSLEELREFIDGGVKA